MIAVSVGAVYDRAQFSGTQLHLNQPLMEPRIVVKAFPLWRNRKVSQRGVARLQSAVKIGECGIEVSDGR